MKYFEVTFPNHTTLVLYSKIEGSHNSVMSVILETLLRSNGLKAISGAIYNPRQFLSVNPISSPDKRQKLLARELKEVLL